MIKKISHIAIVVPELETSLKFWVETLGLPLSHVEHVPEQRVDVAFLPAGESDVELLQPIDDESGVARYLQKRGPGIHHICFEVEDIVETLDRLKAAGIPLIDEEPTIGTGGKKIAFIHPKGTGGVLVELYELTPEEPTRRLERLFAMQRRVSKEGRVYAAGVFGFLAGLRTGGNGHQHEEEEE
ncbi:MAG: methylmalonyl-CoA epimerase [Anaerolineales bacterium]|nr:methylmalonyl-CoA epimerase [Anaerolineales bacterium]MCB8960751.1 methylmalonyl-CoA epimerase [Ardenticatenales bacterium]